VRTQRLHRTWYRTDVEDAEPEYLGMFSDPFPAEDPDRKIVKVDWSQRGWVEVTWLTYS
jgi:hypothetical protein